MKDPNLRAFTLLQYLAVVIAAVGPARSPPASSMRTDTGGALLSADGDASQPWLQICARDLHGLRHCLGGHQACSAGARVLSRGFD